MKRLGLHLTSARPAWSSGSRRRQSPPASCASSESSARAHACGGAAGPLAVFGPVQAAQRRIHYVLKHSNSLLAMCGVRVLQCVRKLLQQVKAAKAGGMTALRDEHAAAMKTSKRTSRLLCRRGSKPPVGSTNIILLGPWQCSRSKVTCACAARDYIHEGRPGA